MTHELTWEPKALTLRFGERIGYGHSLSPLGWQHAVASKVLLRLRSRMSVISLGRSDASGVCSHRKVRLRRVPPYFISMIAVEKR